MDIENRQCTGTATDGDPSLYDNSYLVQFLLDVKPKFITPVNNRSPNKIKWHLPASLLKVNLYFTYESRDTLTKIYNYACAEPLFCSLSLLFRDVPVAFAVVVFRPRLHGSGQIFARTKTCTVSPCVYTGPAELDEFLNG